MNVHRPLLSAKSFLTVQAVLLSLLMGVPWLRARSLDRLPRLPVLATEPLAIGPLYDEPLVVTDQQLATVRNQLRPRLRTKQPKINNVDHALRFWGVSATFADEECLSGEEMRRILTDHRAFTEVWGEKARPLLLIKDGGIAVRTQQGNSSASHVDHTLATLAEVGTSLHHQMVTPQQAGTLQRVLHRALDQFNVNQTEYEWTTLAAALYVVDGTPWYTAEGERVDFNRLARRLMRQQWVQGVCYGNHRLYTLVMLLRIDDHKQLLGAETRRAVLDHLQEATRRLVASQSTDGYWDRNWPNAQAGVKEDDLDELSRRLLATGHALEWWAMAPQEVHPPREVVVRAGQWLVKQVENMDTATIDKNYTFLTHVGRALGLWRASLPWQSGMQVGSP